MFCSYLTTDFFFQAYFAPTCSRLDIMPRAGGFDNHVEEEDMPERKLDHSRPPLPFMGSKMRWWRELEGLARSLPHGGCVFDAFGGSLSAARVIKDARPDLTVVTNDYEHVYSPKPPRSCGNCRASCRRKRVAVLSGLIPRYRHVRWPSSKRRATVRRRGDGSIKSRPSVTRCR